MLPLERQQLILKRILRNGKATIDELSDHLKVSGMTIRRDLVQLEEEGAIIRTHGGAISAQSLIPEIPYSHKASHYMPQKRAIAKTAAKLIPKGARILLDSGTTTLELARAIAWRDDLTIVTNDVMIAIELLNSKSHVIITGGDLQLGVGALLGPQAQHLLTQIRVDLLFLGAHAIDMTVGITAPEMDKALIKRMMIEAAAKTWVVADSSKIGKRSFTLVTPLAHVEGIITDDDCTAESKTRLEKQVHVQYAS